MVAVKSQNQLASIAILIAMFLLTTLSTVQTQLQHGGNGTRSTQGNQNPSTPFPSLGASNGVNAADVKGQHQGQGSNAPIFEDPNATIATWTKVIGVCGAFGTMASLFLFWVTRKAAKAAERAAEVASMDMEFGRRAYLQLSEFRVFPTNPDSLIEFKITNVGGTPAKVLQVMTNCYVGPAHWEDLPETDHITLIPEAASNYPIMPSQTAIEHRPFTLTKEDRHKLLHLGEVLTISSVVHYEDVFQQPQETRVGMYWVHVGDKLIAIRAKGHNHAT